MPTEIHRDEVQRLLEAGARFVDVLPPMEYREQHLRGALSIPLKQLNAETTADLRRDQPVIVYCHDYQ